MTVPAWNLSVNKEQGNLQWHGPEEGTIGPQLIPKDKAVEVVAIRLFGIKLQSDEGKPKSNEAETKLHHEWKPKPKPNEAETESYYVTREEINLKIVSVLGNDSKITPPALVQLRHLGKILLQGKVITESALSLALRIGQEIRRIEELLSEPERKEDAAGLAAKAKLIANLDSLKREIEDAANIVPEKAALPPGLARSLLGQCDRVRDALIGTLSPIRKIDYIHGFILAPINDKVAAQLNGLKVAKPMEQNLHIQEFQQEFHKALQFIDEQYNKVSLQQEHLGQEGFSEIVENQWNAAKRIWSGMLATTITNLEKSISTPADEQALAQLKEELTNAIPSELIDEPSSIQQDILNTHRTFSSVLANIAFRSRFGEKVVPTKDEFDTLTAAVNNLSALWAYSTSIPIDSKQRIEISQMIIKLGTQIEDLLQVQLKGIGAVLEQVAKTQNLPQPGPLHLELQNEFEQYAALVERMQPLHGEENSPLMEMVTGMRGEVQGLIDSVHFEDGKYVYRALAPFPKALSVEGETEQTMRRLSQQDIKNLAELHAHVKEHSPKETEAEWTTSIITADDPGFKMLAAAGLVTITHLSTQQKFALFHKYMEDVPERSQYRIDNIESIMVEAKMGEDGEPALDIRFNCRVNTQGGPGDDKTGFIWSPAKYSSYDEAIDLVQAAQAAVKAQTEATGKEKPRGGSPLETK